MKRDLQIIKGFSADMPPSLINSVAQDEEVTKILFDTEVQVCLDTATAAIDAPAEWMSGFTGEGITVAVIDTGIYPHQDLTQPVNRIVAFKDFINGRTAPYDDNGHGTHVAGIIAGNGNKSNGLYKGVAPNAKLVGVKVMDSKASGRTSDVVAGIQWVVQNKDQYNIRLLNLSLGAPVTDTSLSDPLSQAAETAWNAGIVVVAAAGNNGPMSGSICTPGVNPKIITVGAVNDNGTIDIKDDVIADFSSRGPVIGGFIKPDVVAPGVGITSLVSDISYLPKKNNSGSKIPISLPSNYSSMSGTSMSTPVVTGAAAIMMQKNSTLTPEQLKGLITEGAVDLGFLPNDQGNGEVRL